MKELLIGCVGKPSAGKSTFFNATVEKTSAKMGAYPFTTIEPNRGVAFYRCPCPCSRFPGIICIPEDGFCHEGTRRVPVKLLDIAGLIPNAHQGAGLGNQFLDDIRQADVLLHIVDISGTTDEKGEELIASEYDPTGDHLWLMTEITEWIYGNFLGHWPSIVRRSATGTTDAVKILHEKLSGYYCLLPTVVETLRQCGYSGHIDYSLWTKDDIRRFCKTFVSIRFPTILVLNKSEKGAGAADAHVANMSRRFPEVPIILTSAKSELKMKQWVEQDLIAYDSLNGTVDQLKDLPQCDEDEFDFIKKFVLKRCGSTGTQRAIQSAIDLVQRQVVFPVDSLTEIRQAKGGESFRHALLIPRSLTIKELASDTIKRDASGVVAESVDGARLSSDDRIDQIPIPYVVRISIGNKPIFNCASN